MNAADVAALFRDAAGAADECAAADVAEHLRSVSDRAADDPVLAVEMWTAMRDTLFLIASAERRPPT